MKKIIGATILLLLLAFVGCASSKPALEYGFENSSDPDISYRCGYVLPQTEFEMNNVFIDVYYGEIGGGSLENNQTMRLYFIGAEPTDPWYEDDNVCFIKELSSEEFNSDKYIWKGKEGYHERMIIPEELFDRQEGSITFIMVIYREPTSDRPDGFGSRKSFRVNFSLEGDIVTLSVPKK